MSNTTFMAAGLTVGFILDSFFFHNNKNPEMLSWMFLGFTYISYRIDQMEASNEYQD